MPGIDDLLGYLDQVGASARQRSLIYSLLKGLSETPQGSFPTNEYSGFGKYDTGGGVGRAITSELAESVVNPLSYIAGPARLPAKAAGYIQAYHGTPNVYNLPDPAYITRGIEGRGYYASRSKDVANVHTGYDEGANVRGVLIPDDFKFYKQEQGKFYDTEVLESQGYNGVIYNRNGVDNYVIFPGSYDKLNFGFTNSGTPLPKQVGDMAMSIIRGLLGGNNGLQ